MGTVELSENDRVPIMIWEIFDKDEQSLDIYECYPRLYRKEYVAVKINNRKTQVMMYVMNPGRPLGKPSVYYSTILLLSHYKSYVLMIGMMDTILNLDLNKDAIKVITLEFSRTKHLKSFIITALVLW